jgi:hypothetical protein
MPLAPADESVSHAVTIHSIGTSVANATTEWQTDEWISMMVLSG